MGEAVDLLQLLDADLGVNLRGVEPGMAEQLPNEADVRVITGQGDNRPVPLSCSR